MLGRAGGRGEASSSGRGLLGMGREGLASCNGGEGGVEGQFWESKHWMGWNGGDTGDALSREDG